MSEISLRERIRINLVSAMESASINQVQLAEKLGISKGTVNNWVRGNNSPDVDMVPKICNVLGISVLDLYSPTKFESQENAKKSPSTAEAVPEEPNSLRDILLNNFEKLNDEGQEKLVDTSDDMVSSGKYIKSDPNKLGKKNYA